MTQITCSAIALVRHGQTNWNVDRRIQGRTEVPLNDNGRAQARAAARTLASAEVAGALAATAGALSVVPEVVSSPLGRAIETAEIIAEALALAAPSVKTGLIERDFGAAEGLGVAEAEARWPGLRVPDAEPLDTLSNRSAEVFQALLETSPGAIVVAHGAMLRWGLAHLCGIEMPRILNGEVWLLTRSATGRFEVVAPEPC
ncbi:MAG: histidine phosphatase family protein [Microbacteriaceae bacterium]